MDRVRYHQVRAKVFCVERQLLQEERIAVGLTYYFFAHQLDEALRTEHRTNHLKAVVAGQWLQRRLLRIRLVNPRGAVPRPIGRQHQDAGVGRILDQEPDELFRYPVDPVEVLEHQYQRA
jgi:hypothetical protein